MFRRKLRIVRPTGRIRIQRGSDKRPGLRHRLGMRPLPWLQNCFSGTIPVVLGLFAAIPGSWMALHGEPVDATRFWRLKNRPVIPLEARGHDRRVDLRWRAPNTPIHGYVIQRASSEEGPFTPLNSRWRRETFYSDYLGANGQTRWYRVIGMYQGAEAAFSRPVQATTRAMTNQELLTSVQEATFRYFKDDAHPVSGLARERTGSGDTCTSGGTGFGLMAWCVAVERGFVSRQEAAGHVLKVLRFLEEETPRYHGAWSHWIHGRTGRTIPFSLYDDGGDIVETSYLAQALLTLRQYFTEPTPTEEEIVQRCTRLWEQIEWDWYLRSPDGKWLYWHWSPRYGWKMNHRVGGQFNECLITYLLAIASPTHPIPPSCYRTGWTGDPPVAYVNGRTYYGYKLAVGMDYGGPCFSRTTRFSDSIPAIGEMHSAITLGTTAPSPASTGPTASTTRRTSRPTASVSGD